MLLGLKKKQLISMIVNKTDSLQILNKIFSTVEGCGLAVTYNIVMKMTGVAKSCLFIYN